MDNLTISNFRVIQGSETLEFNPITILTGTNNSGKSTVLKGILLLSDYLSSRNQLKLDFNGTNSMHHKIDCFENAINWSNWKDGIRQLLIEYEIRNHTVILQFGLVEGISKDDHEQSGARLLSVDITNTGTSSKYLLRQLSEFNFNLAVDRRFITDWKELRDDVYSTAPQDDDWDLNAQYEELLESVKEKKAKLAELEEGGKEYILLNDSLLREQRMLKDIKQRIGQNDNSKKPKDRFEYNTEFNLGKVIFDNTIPAISRIMLRKHLEKSASNESSRKDAFEESQLLDDILNRILGIEALHLSPNRNSQMRLYLNEGRSSDFNELIDDMSRNPIVKGSSADIFLKKWMTEFDIGIDFRKREVEGIASILEIKGKNGWRNLVDKGFGAGQVMAILLRIASAVDLSRKSKRYYRSGIKILIEEPESNLHPAMQSKLAELFLDAYNKFNIEFIIETHSEYLIRRIQILVKNKQLESDTGDNPFKLYYFPKDAQPYEMRFRSDGVFLDQFGSGFFDAATSDALQLIKKG